MIPKFRAWHKQFKLMKLVRKLDLDYDRVFVALDSSKRQKTDANREPWNFNNIELMQWTGKIDQKGVDIYEGDILEHANDIYVIESIFPLGRENEAKMIKSWSVHAKNLNEYNTTDWTSWCEDDWEIIGNIYENPKLLEESNDNQGRS